MSLPWEGRNFGLCSESPPFRFPFPHRFTKSAMGKFMNIFFHRIPHSERDPRTLFGTFRRFFPSTRSTGLQTFRVTPNNSPPKLER